MKMEDGNLRLRRQRLGLTLAQVAAIANVSGATTSCLDAVRFQSPEVSRVTLTRVANHCAENVVDPYYGQGLTTCTSSTLRNDPCATRELS